MYIQQPFFTPFADWKPTPVSKLPRWSDQKRVGLDIETHDPQLTKLGPGVRRDGRIIGVSFAFEDGLAKYIPVEMSYIWEYLREQVKGFRGEIVGANLQYDLDYLEEAGVIFHKSVRMRDVQLAEPLIDELQFSYSLDSIAARWSVPLKNEEQLLEAGRCWGLGNKVKKHMWKLPYRYVGPYAEYDALLPLRVLREQEKALKQQNLETVWDLETDVLPVALAMRRRGVRIDTKKLTEIEDWASRVETEEMAKVSHITQVCVSKGDTNKASILALCLSGIGLECPLTPKSKKPSITADFLLANPHPVTKALLRARQFAKLRTTFCKQVQSHMTRGRVHCTFNQLRMQRDDGDLFGAAGGRMSSTNFNIQQQPIRHEEYGQLWRSVFIPDEDCYWTCADYSGQEPTLITHFASLSGCRGADEFIKALIKDPNLDCHQMTADMAEISRGKAKTVFLGLAYKMGRGTLCHELGLPYTWKTVDFGEGPKEIRVAGPEGHAFLEKFKRRFPFLYQFALKAEKRAEKRGHVFTLLKRRCRFRIKKNGQFDEVRKAGNKVVQGSAAEQMKVAMRDLHAAGFPLQIQVHDEVDWSEYCTDRMKEAGEIMRNAVKLVLPSKVHIEYGDSWGNLNQKV